MKFCGVVVWYNPATDVLDNINSYITEIEKLYIIDNSKYSHINLLADYKYQNKCKYIPLHKNLGLAYTLNVGCKKAIKDRFDYILTMDQDSMFEPTAVSKLKVAAQKDERYGIICPNVKSIYHDEKTNLDKVAYLKWKKEEFKEISWTMTSGSLTSLKAYTDVGGFDDDLFIAHIDIDFCIRLKQNNWKILMVGPAVIKQRFGNSKPVRILWKKVHPSFANPVRTYYLFRNQKYLEMKYGKEIHKFIGVDLWKFFVKITLFEKQKLKKYLMMLQGYRDAKANRMGKYKD